MAKRKGREAHPEGDKVSIGPEERARLKALREGRGWSQKELATRAGTTQGTISNLESSDRQPYRSVYERIVAVLRTDSTAAETQKLYERIVAGAAKLTESDQRAVAALIDVLEKARTQK